VFDAGIAKVYIKIPAKSETGMGLEVLEFVSEIFYGETSFTVQEYYAAKQEKTKIAKRIRIRQDTTIGNNHVIILDGVQYDVGRTYSTIDKGIAITDITLEKTTTRYGLKLEEGENNNGEHDIEGTA